jgi:YidC/Oxa1 family membrane protein insertase
MDILLLIPKALGQLLNFIYNTLAFHNYGLAIIIFTIIIKICILPLTLKQLKSSSAMQALQPQLQEIQKKYKNDKQKLQIETMNFYKENKVNPAGGCLPLLVQMPILISLWQVIVRPLTYMLNWSPELINSKIAELKPTELIRGYKELSVVIKAAGKILDMNFLGLNLGKIPKYTGEFLFNSPDRMEYWGLLMLPILATVTTFLSTKLMMMGTKHLPQANAQMAGMQNTMMYIAPLMTLIFSFQFPAGLSLYWVTGYVFQIFQQLYINKTIYKKKEVVIK